MNNYVKNYGLWLGGGLVLGFIITYLIYVPIFTWLFLIAGTIIGTVKTHKAEGQRIKFGKAAGAVILILCAYHVLSLVVNIAQWGTDGIGFYIPFFLTNVFITIMFSLSILMAAGVWYMFEKAGKPGWASIVPIYNIIVMLEIAQKPTWWLAMFFLPIANIIFLVMMFNGISKSFGKDAGFTVGMVFLNQIFFAILGYGSAEYLMNTAPVNNDLLDN